MKAKARIRFCIGDLTTKPGTIIDFTDAKDQLDMLLKRGWIELLDVPAV